MEVDGAPVGGVRAPFIVRLPEEWYVACLSDELRRRPLARAVLDVPTVLFRDHTSRAVAVLDRCPHRNAPLSVGRVRGGLLECRYHGWAFDGDGRCRRVPGLPEGAADDDQRAVAQFACVEQDGFVWVRIAGDRSTGPPFRFPHVADSSYTTVRRRNEVDATLYAALENTLDVPHTAVLHGGLFRGGLLRRAEPRRRIEVVVRRSAGRVEAEYVGEARPGGVAARLLATGGGELRHFDRFMLPSIAQVEYQLGRNHLMVTTAFTPVSDFRTAMHTAVTFRLRVPHGFVRAAVTPVANRIFSQDAAILAQQSANVRRFGGERFVSTDLDVLGGHIVRMLRRAERGDTREDAPEERRITMLV